MSCKYCGLPCRSACLSLEQARVLTFPRIFEPSYTRERQARGYAMIRKAFMAKGYSDTQLLALDRFATEKAGRKTVARAIELLDDDFVCQIASRMAEKGFKSRESTLFTSLA